MNNVKCASPSSTDCTHEGQPFSPSGRRANTSPRRIVDCSFRESLCESVRKGEGIPA